MWLISTHMRLLMQPICPWHQSRASLCPHGHVLFTASLVCLLLLASVISSDGTGGMDCNIPAHLSTPRDRIWRRTHSCPDLTDVAFLHFLFHAKLTASFALLLPANHPTLIRKLNISMCRCVSDGVFVCLLQGGGFGESTYRPPHGPEQPLHPGGSREQLLSLSHDRKAPTASPFWGPKVCVEKKVRFQTVFCCCRRGGASSVALRPATTRWLQPVTDGGQTWESQAVTQPFSFLSDLQTRLSRGIVN